MANKKWSGMDMTTIEIKEKLDKLYWSDIQGYLTYLNNVKNAGYRVYRNSKGIHKVEVNMDQAFGGIFGNIFNGGQK